MGCKASKGANVTNPGRGSLTSTGTTFTAALAAAEGAAVSAFQVTKMAVDVLDDMVDDLFESEESEKDDENTLYLVFEDEEDEDHRIGFSRRFAAIPDLGIIFAEFGVDETKVVGFRKYESEAVSEAEKLGVKKGWVLIKINQVVVKDMSPQDTITFLREREQLLPETREFRPWNEVLDEEKRMMEEHNSKLTTTLGDAVEPLQARTTAFRCEDPRQHNRVNKDDLYIVAFHYPGLTAPVDKYSEAGFLSPFWDSPPGEGIRLADAAGEDEWYFPNAEVAFLAMEVWSRGDELRFTGAEDARRAVDLLKRETDLQDADEIQEVRNLSVPMGSENALHLNTYIGYGTRLNGVLAVLRAKFVMGTTLGNALIATGGTFLLYLPVHQEHHEEEESGTGSSTRRLHKRGHRRTRKRKNSAGIPLSEIAFDVEGLNNTLGLLLMKVRSELTATDAKWGEWLDGTLQLDQIIAGEKSSALELAKMRWNALVATCAQAVTESLQRRSERARKSSKEPDPQSPHTGSRPETHAANQEDDVLALTESAAELDPERRIERLYQTPADAGMSVFKPVWEYEAASRVTQRRATLSAPLSPPASTSSNLQSRFQAGIPKAESLALPAQEEAFDFLGDALADASAFHHQPAARAI
eukprot:CAMPEP_0178437788 /NCGR_PEP_ID=MMETSP0689_2-20121128/35200_1 /TAXON_ID=160604 /ORGANISM="Amphidinium massartii, Strain CS-259" /LENGTH=640 /DNA_ID=CAMNT_0020060055 /DNA_START=108 /DNA_END=2030 /DNA_ORIENTATION=-